MKTIMITLLTLSMLVASKGMAQKGNVELSLHSFDLELKSRPEILKYTFDKDDNYIILKRQSIKGPGGWRYYLETRDSDGEKISVKEISSKLDADNYPIMLVTLLQDRIVVFSSKFNKAQNNEKFLFQTININNLKVSQREIFYDITYEKRNKRPIFSMQVSKNKKYFLITTIPPYKKKEKQFITLELLDQDLKSIWRQENYDFDELDKNYLLVDYVAGNTGEAYVLGKVKLDNENNTYQLFKFDKKGVDKEELELGEIESQGTSLIADVRGGLFVTGYFTNGDTRGVKGMFLKKINKSDLSFEKEVEVDFSDEMLLFGKSVKRQEKTKKKAKKKDFEIGVFHLKMEYIRYDDAGNIYVIGSQNWVHVSTYTDANGNTRTTTTYFNNDIFVSKFSKDFKHIYNAKVLKMQVTKSPVESPYTFLIKNGEISFVFFDNRENQNPQSLSLKGVYRLGGYKGNVLAIATIDKNGEMQRDILFDYMEKGYDKFNLEDAIMGNTEIMYLLYTKKREYHLGLIE